MKKILIYICLFAVSFCVISCKKDLNIVPQNIIQDETVFNNESAIKAYLASLYSDLPIEDFNYVVGGGFNNGNDAPGTSNITDESMACVASDGQGIGGGTSLGYWAYSSIRNVNGFIAKIPTSSFSDIKKNIWLGEAKFIRAYYYFGMVKRYGGVPIVTDVQSFTGNNLDQLKVPRNTEKEVYDFIAKDLDEAVKLLDKTNEAGRATIYAAYALKSRAMIYAAAEAAYGTVQLNGLVGIPPSNAPAYWKLAYDAASQVINSGSFSLYNKSADKSANYTSLFLDTDNPENIFVKKFFYPNKAHSYDLWVLPHHGVGPSIGYGSRINPSLELCESYEYIDGSNGKLKITDVSNHPIVYANPSDIFANKDPRLSATFLLPFSTWKGYTMDVRAGIIDAGTTITSGSAIETYKGFNIIGINGIGGGQEVSQTGFYVRKYLNPNYDKTTVVNKSSSQQFIDFRYAEILLNYAEAAVELGNVADAMTALNLIRVRAGIAPVISSQVTRDKIRHERRIELALEPHRYWDIRRWHIADALLNNTKFTALLPYLILPGGSSYSYGTAEVGFSKTFTPNMYYERIDPGEITKNPNLLQNPGY